MITELTEEQKKMMPVYVDKWVKIGLSTEPIKDYEETINLFYEKVLNKKRPAKIILLPSPTWQKLFAQVEEVDSESVKEREESESGIGSTWMYVVEQVWEQIKGQVQVWELVWRQIWKELTERELVWWQEWEKVGEQGRVWEEVGGWGEAWLELIYCSNNSFHFDIEFAFYDYCNQVLGVQYPDNWPIYKKTAELSSVYMFDDICILPDRPEQITMKNRVLHNESGMAIKYRDGWGVYYLNGVRVTKEIVETPADKLDPEIILKETNTEVRREIVRKIGAERLEEKLKPRVLDRWGDYELHDYSHLFPNMRCKPVYLKMKNPSIGVWHYEGVNINEMETPTCQAALKWRLKGKDFKPIRIT